MKRYACSEPCDGCDTPGACAFLRDFDARREEELRSTQMLGGVLLWVLVVCIAGAVWALASFFQEIR